MAMMRRLRWVARLAQCALSAYVLSACLGGQTGQPTGLTCQVTPPESVAPDQDYDGITPRALAQSFVGKHSAPLLWRTGELATSESQPVGNPDEITFVVSYSDVAGTGSKYCNQQLSVVVAVEITTRDTGLHQTGTLALVAVNGQLEAGSFTVTSDAATVTVMFSGAPNPLEMSGTVEAQSGSWPSKWAQFSNQDLGSGGAGGGGGP
jgi:hypothetical protein